MTGDDTLFENYNSDEIEGEAILTNESGVINVLVEDEYDVPFWNKILRIDGFEFNISPFHNPENDDLISDNKGKPALMSLTFGPHLIGCVDSDYDYLLSEKSDVSKKMNSDKYILHTYTYSVENYICNALTLRDVCIDSTCTSAAIDFSFVDLLKNYSKIIYPLLIWSILLKHNDNISFSIDDYNLLVKTSKTKKDHGLDEILHDIDNTVKIKITQLETDFHFLIDSKSEFEQKMRVKGLNEENAYLFTSGHGLYDFLFSSFLKPVCEELTGNHYKAISSFNIEPLRKKELRENYDKKWTPVKFVLRNNINTLYLCETFHYIQKDIERLKSNL